MTDLELSVRGQRLLVQMDRQEESVTPTGIITVESHAPGVIGTVIHCGEDVIDVKKGDVVLFAPQAGRTMAFQGTEYLVLDEDEVLAIWDSEKTAI